MRRITRKVLTATGLATTAVALAAVPAASAGPVTYAVQNGGDVAGTNVGNFVLLGRVNGAILKCTSSTVTGSMPSSTELSGDNIATLDDVSFSSPGENANDWCETSSGTAQVTHPDAIPGTPGLDWEFDATEKAGANTTDGRLNNVKVKLYMPNLGCDVTIGGPGPNGSGGYVEGTYTNPSTLTSGDGWISMPILGVNNLTVLSVSGPSYCTDFPFSVGETFWLEASYSVVRTGPVPPAAGISPSIN